MVFAAYNKQSTIEVLLRRDLDSRGIVDYKRFVCEVRNAHKLWTFGEIFRFKIPQENDVGVEIENTFRPRKLRE